MNLLVCLQVCEGDKEINTYVFVGDQGIRMCVRMDKGMNMCECVCVCVCGGQELIRV